MRTPAELRLLFIAVVRALQSVKTERKAGVSTVVKKTGTLFTGDCPVLQGKSIIPEWSKM